MNIHEYQAKQLFAEYGIPVAPGKPAQSVEEALAAASALGGKAWVVKAQVHAGGRGKAGGVRRARSREELESIVCAMLGSRLVTHQSGPLGQPVNCVLLQPLIDIAAEMYVGMLVDRSLRRIALLASAAGGMEIEEVAARTPEKLFRVAIDPVVGLLGYQCRGVAAALGLKGALAKTLTDLLMALYRLFLDKDLSLVEVNPLILTADGALQALDAKVAIDDNALFRQPLLRNWRDPTQEDPKESHARRFDLNYVAMDGDIGCMVNGAGLAMATMDLVKLHGGRPANFLDVGGGTTPEKVAEAFKLLVGDGTVRAILVNIFGGIVRCDLIAEGVLRALAEVDVRVPVVVRLEGTNVEEGYALLARSELSIITAGSLDEAARKAVAAAKGGD